MIYTMLILIYLIAITAFLVFNYRFYKMINSKEEDINHDKRV